MSFAPFLALLAEDTGQHRHELRKVANATHPIAHASTPRQMLVANLGLRAAADQLRQQGLAAGERERFSAIFQG